MSLNKYVGVNLFNSLLTKLKNYVDSENDKNISKVSLDGTGNSYLLQNSKNVTLGTIDKSSARELIIRGYQPTSTNNSFQHMDPSFYGISVFSAGTSIQTRDRFFNGPGIGLPGGDFISLAQNNNIIINHQKNMADFRFHSQITPDGVPMIDVDTPKKVTISAGASSSYRTNLSVTKQENEDSIDYNIHLEYTENGPTPSPYPPIFGGGSSTNAVLVDISNVQGNMVYLDEFNHGGKILKIVGHNHIYNEIIFNVSSLSILQTVTGFQSSQNQISFYNNGAPINNSVGDSILNTTKNSSFIYIHSGSADDCNLLIRNL